MSPVQFYKRVFMLKAIFATKFDREKFCNQLFVLKYAFRKGGVSNWNPKKWETRWQFHKHNRTNYLWPNQSNLVHFEKLDGACMQLTVQLICLGP
jgi:hypothetical protein